MIAWSRIAKDEHWPTDVAVGAILGHSLGRMVVARQEGFRRKQHGRLHPMVDPRTGARGIAYAITW